MANPTGRESIVIDNSKGGGKIAYEADELIYVPHVPGNATVTDLASATTLTSSHYSVNLTNTGAGATRQHTLPKASTVKGKCLHFQLTEAQIVQLDPNGTESVFLGGSGVAGKYLQVAAAIGNYVTLWSDGVRHHVVGYSGVITKEA
jgi:hypothetical protein